MSLRSWSLAVVVGLLLGTAACAQSTGVGARQPTSVAEQPTVAPLSAEQRHQLATQKKAAGIAGCPVSNATAAPVRDGLPDVVLTCLGGGRDVHLAGLRGRPMLINVWAQWCGPCRTEAPYLEQVAAANTSRALIVGVDYVDPQPALALEFAHASGWRYPQLADTDKQLAAPLQIIGPPYTFFVRADGTIAGKHAGGFTSAAQIRTLAKQELGVDL